MHEIRPRSSITQPVPRCAIKQDKYARSNSNFPRPICWGRGIGNGKCVCVRGHSERVKAKGMKGGRSQRWMTP